MTSHKTNRKKKIKEYGLPKTDLGNKRNPDKKQWEKIITP